MHVEIWTNLPAVAPSAIRRLTREEYDQLVDRGAFERERLELIRGVIVRTAPQGVEHTRRAGAHPDPDAAQRAG